MIDPNEISTIRVGQLATGTFNLSNFIAHEIGTELFKGSIEDLSIFIAAYIGASDGVGFRAVTVTDGQTLPATTNQEFILVGKGTFYNVNGGATIVTTKELNAIVSNGTFWFIGVEIPVNVELAGIVQTIRQGEISTAPSEDAVFKALALKGDIGTFEEIANKISFISGYSETLYPNEKATRDGLDTKLNISDLPSNLTLYATTAPSGIAGYTKWVSTLNDPDYNTTAVNVSTGIITTVDQLISGLTSVGGVIVGNPGAMNVTTVGNIRKVSGTGIASFYFELYQRTEAGVETLIGVSNPTEPIENTVYGEFQATAVWNNGTFLATDRVVIKFYGNRIAGGVDPTYEFQFGGLTPVRTIVPVPFRVVAGEYELKANKVSTITASDILYPNNNAVIAKLDLKADLIDGLVPQSQLPSFVDDVLEFNNLAEFPTTGEVGKIYIAIDSGKQYRWSGSSYIQITNGLIASTNDVPEGSNNLYFLVSRVLATILTGLSTASSSVITAADTVLTALGKLQGQVSLRELLSNKQNSLTTDGTGTKYPTVDAVNGGLVSKDIVTNSFPLNLTYSTPTASGINLISSELFTKGTVNEIKINAQSAGIIKFAFFRKISSSPLNYKVIKYFNCRVSAGINNLKVNEFINENFYFGVVDNQTAFYTAEVSSGDPVDLHYLIGGITDASVWGVSTGRGTNIEIKVNNTIDKIKYTGKSLCLIGDSITDFCDSPSSNGQQYMGYDYFIQQKINFINIFNEGYSGIQLGQSGGFANTKVSTLPVADEYTIFLGTNDFAYGTQTILGTFDDYLNNTGVNTFYGAMRVLIDGIYVKNPLAKIILFTPTPRNYAGLNSWDSVNSNGNLFLDFVNAIMLIGQNSSLSVVDLYSESNINGYNFSLTTYDNLHPTTRGYQYISEAFINKMYNNY